jgi:hypothetical protein
MISFDRHGKTILSVLSEHQMSDVDKIDQTRGRVKCSCHLWSIQISRDITNNQDFDAAAMEVWQIHFVEQLETSGVEINWDALNHLINRK